MKNRIIFLVILFLSTLSLSAQSSVEMLEEEIVMHSTLGGDIFGTLAIPDSEQRQPIVILLTGSGPVDRNGNAPFMLNFSHRMMAEGLYENEIATLRFDKRGIAASREAGMAEEGLLFEHYISDLRDWIELISKDERFSEIIIAGHSEGSLIGMCGAIDNKRVSKYISIAGAGEPIGKILRWQLGQQTKDQELINRVDTVLIKLENGEFIAELELPSTLHALFRKSIQPYMISWLKYNPQTEIAKLQIPILLLQGTTDLQVVIAQVELLHQANPKAEKVIIENMNHVLKECDSMDMTVNFTTYIDRTLPLSEKLIPEMVRFIKGH